MGLKESSKNEWTRGETLRIKTELEGVIRNTSREEKKNIRRERKTFLYSDKNRKYRI